MTGPETAKDLRKCVRKCAAVVKAARKAKKSPPGSDGDRHREIHALVSNSTDAAISAGEGRKKSGAERFAGMAADGRRRAAKRK
jgi:hypothetical protein